MTWHPAIVSPKTGQVETNWLMSYSTEAAALEYAEAWSEMEDAVWYDAVEGEEDE